MNKFSFIKKNISDSTIKISVFFTLLVFAIGIGYVGAWIGPSTSAPSGNKSVVLNSASELQKKGGNGVASLPALLDIDGTLSAHNVAVWNSTQVVGDYFIHTMEGNDISSVNVCINPDHKFTTDCPAVPKP
ncbi:hypothetical protein IT401_01885 [Candidatus Nomurabacteria bacterium]|nr:hypothetical protein [Candidatus Nomurabacteria bacterium]